MIVHDHATISARTLTIVRDLGNELHPGQNTKIVVELESDLDRDLGFDSLGRAELILRLDRAFKVRLPDRLIADARTPCDLSDAIVAARPSVTEGLKPAKMEVAPLTAVTAPVLAKTMVEALQYHALAHPDRVHVGLWEGHRIDDRLTYGDLHHLALRLARGLEAVGVVPGERIAIMLPTGRSFFLTFFGVLYVGGVPVPIYPPFRRAQVDDHIRRQAGILTNAGARVLVTEDEFLRVGGLLKGLVRELRHIVSADSLLRHGRLERPRPANADTIALIQYTSGSTGDPKGVVLSHANLLANIRAMGEALEATSTDVFVSWLPLYHDMGLIGAWLGSLYFGTRVVIMSPLTFLADPTRWLRAISQQRGTLSAAPNFAFEFCLKNVRDEDMYALDLSSLRTVVNGAEPVSPTTIRNFTARFARYGFRPEAMGPVYGLAESSVGLAFPPAGRPPIIDRVERSTLVDSGAARPASPDDPTAIEFVACGRPLSNHQVRIVDNMGLELPERHQGRLQFTGPSATRGYFRNEKKTRELFSGDWLESGDLAYISAGDVYLTGRIKDMIIRAGRNIYPHEVEEFIGGIAGVRKGCVAAFPSPDSRTGSERLIVLAETRLTVQTDLDELRKTISDASLDLLDMPPDEVLLAPPHTVPKTSSGKIRRSAAKALFEAGALEGKAESLWWQVARLQITGFANRFWWAFRSASAVAYAGYWWLILCIIACVIWPAIMILPGRAGRHATIAAATRLWFWLTGISFKVAGHSGREIARAIIVANHASYLDGAALSAAMPGELSFIAKQELASQFFAGGFLRRIGTLFVRRVDRAAGVKAADTIVAAAKAGERLVAFPEGTLLRRPGLLDFRLGAFMAAAQAGVAVVPVAIRGTRTVLRGEQWFPRPGGIAIEIGKPIHPDGNDFHAAIKLRNAARAWVLDHCGEPDLAGEDVDLGALEQL